jgi:hypothetical protein
MKNKEKIIAALVAIDVSAVIHLYMTTLLHVAERGEALLAEEIQPLTFIFNDCVMENWTRAQLAEALAHKAQHHSLGAMLGKLCNKAMEHGKTEEGVHLLSLMDVLMEV